MKRHLNTLYVTYMGAHLHKDGENAVIRVGDEERGRVPVHLIGAIVCFGSIGVSPALMGHCAEKGVRLSFLGRSGRFLARVEGPTSGNVLLRRGQYRAADDENATSEVVRGIVSGKLLNQRAVVRRAVRDHGSDYSEAAAERLDRCVRRLTNGSRRSVRASSTDSLRGFEGEGAPGLLGGLRRPDTRRQADLRLRPEVEAASARPRQRPAVVPIRAPGERLPVGGRNSRSRSGRRIPAPR